MKIQTMTSPLADSAVHLATKFSDFQQFAAELDRKAIESDKGLERACHLLAELDTCGQGIQSALMAFTQTLEAEREKTEVCAQMVAAKAQKIAERRGTVEKMAARLKEFGDRVNVITNEIALLKPSKDSEISESERALLKERAGSVTSRLTLMVNDAAEIKNEAHDLHLETFERTADRLRQSLKSAENRLNQFEI